MNKKTNKVEDNPREEVVITKREDMRAWRMTTEEEPKTQKLMRTRVHRDRTTRKSLLIKKSLTSSRK
jgi:hypothetical protein